MTDKQNSQMQTVDQLLADARETEPRASDALMARIIADADREIDTAAVVRVVPKRRSLAAALRDAVGGWPGLAGLTTATLAGVWIGFASPYALSDLSETIFADETSYDLGDFMPDLNGIFVEG